MATGKELIDELRARSIMALVSEHRKICKGNCDISLYLLKETVEKLLGRELDDVEIKDFL